MFSLLTGVLEDHWERPYQMPDKPESDQKTSTHIFCLTQEI